jgi:hydroxymethylglutaryl-CoA synthase
MAGIVAYGVHIPRYRLSRKTISQAIGWLNPAGLPGEKAVANYDEDSLTMSVAAGRNCLHAVEGGKIDGMYFATTTAPYQERESAAIIATVLDLRSNIRTADFTDSLKAGTAAILSGCDSIKARSANNILLCAADCRLGKPGGSQEMLFGDGAASLLLGNSDVIASLEDSYSVAYDFPDYRRSEYDKFVRTTEDRFIRQQGYTKFIP